MKSFSDGCFGSMFSVFSPLNRLIRMPMSRSCSGSSVLSSLTPTSKISSAVFSHLAVVLALVSTSYSFVLTFKVTFLPSKFSLSMSLESFLQSSIKTPSYSPEFCPFPKVLSLSADRRIISNRRIACTIVANPKSNPQKPFTRFCAENMPNFRHFVHQVPAVGDADAVEHFLRHFADSADLSNGQSVHEGSDFIGQRFQDELSVRLINVSANFGQPKVRRDSGAGS
mmetsp:Transcript_8927/g.13350  ORF Transcript_8927/g.13350 Transcript_8927/m.13350 type:complete len:226 (+) Transcript_8927:242-919(+)